MPLSKEKLLSPRYKIILDFPNNPHEIGHILNYTIGDDWDHKQIATCKKYPHLFQKLEWWQERKEIDMPKYVKHNKTNEVAGFGNRSRINSSDALTSSGWWSLYDCHPSDESEYHQYLLTQKSKQ